MKITKEKLGNKMFTQGTFTKEAVKTYEKLGDTLSQRFPISCSFVVYEEGNVEQERNEPGAYTNL